MLVELTTYETIWVNGPRVDGNNIQVVIINSNLIESMYKTIIVGGKVGFFIHLNKPVAIDYTNNKVDWLIAPHWPEGLLK